MRKIYLFCAAGMSTSVLVKKMQEAAAETNYECEIIAFPVSEVGQHGPEADIILLGPQVRFQLKTVQETVPDKPVEVIEMKDYGMMNGKNVLNTVKEKLGD
ncbi:MAG: PTS sugar transporter subunit IIB [Erysipelotrichaceae bacterium]|nr:PTS sugar transporter subunit IIB [Erysipelotrichaceae bacterium]